MHLFEQKVDDIKKQKCQWSIKKEKISGKASSNFVPVKNDCVKKNPGNQKSSGSPFSCHAVKKCTRAMRSLM